MEFVISQSLTAITRGRFSLSTSRQNYLQAAVAEAQAMVQAAEIQSQNALILLNTKGKDFSDLGKSFVTNLRSNVGIQLPELMALVQPTLAYVRARLISISKGLGQPLRIVDLSIPTHVENAIHTVLGQGVTSGYLRGGEVVRRGRQQAPGRIHVDFGQLGQTHNLARTIVHEASHKYCGTEDHGYHPNLAQLSNVNAKNNADSYAYFAAEFRANPTLAYDN